MRVEKVIETERGRFLIRSYRPEDEAGVLSLWKAAFEKEISPALWRWKYLENPYNLQIALCVNEDGTILVMYGGIPYRTNWKGKTVCVTHLADIMSHPVCRGTGLFVRAGAAFFDLFAGPEATIFYYGFPGKFHFDIGEKYLEYTALKGGVGFLTARTAHLASRVTRFGGQIEQISDIDNSFDRLWKRCRDNYPFALVRDADFLRWRFFKHPLRKYELWGYRSYFKKGLKAYAVFAIEGEKARMVDLFGPPSEKTVTAFLTRLGAQFAERGIERVETWLPGNHFLTRAAISAGFKPLEEPLGIILTGRSFHPALSLEWASANIYYSMADGDLL